MKCKGIISRRRPVWGCTVQNNVSGRFIHRARFQQYPWSSSKLARLEPERVCMRIFTHRAADKWARPTSLRWNWPRMRKMFHSRLMLPPAVCLKSWVKVLYTHLIFGEIQLGLKVGFLKKKPKKKTTLTSYITIKLALYIAIVLIYTLYTVFVSLHCSVPFKHTLAEKQEEEQWNYFLCICQLVRKQRSELRVSHDTAPLDQS